MKHNSLRIIALSMTIFSMGVVAAPSNNTISFQGEVTDETCSLVANGNATSPIILLPTVSTSDLSKSGDTAGATSFEMSVTGCTGSASDSGIDTNISTVFAGNLVETDNGTLGNTGTAENVTIQILDTKSAPIDLSSTYTADGDLTLAPGDTSATATYTAQYYATGAPTAGTVTASLQYAISYQ